MISLIALSKEGRAYISAQSTQDEYAPAWKPFGENIEAVCGSFCGSIFAVINGELFGSRVNQNLLLSPSGIECSLAVIGGSVIVVRARDKMLEKCIFDPVQGKVLSSKKELPLMKRSGSQGGCTVLVSPRDHVLCVNPKGETFLLREDGDSSEGCVWVQISSSPETEPKRGFLGRATSFIQSLTRRKRQTFECTCLCDNSVWLSCPSKPIVYRLQLGDPDALPTGSTLLEWRAYHIEDRSRIVRMCGSPDEAVLWGLDEEFCMKRYTLVQCEEEWTLRSVEISFGEDELREKELMDVCVVCGGEGSPRLAPTSGHVSDDDDLEEFEEAPGFSNLGSLKYVTRYCCTDGDCDTCVAMESAELMHFQNSSVEVSTSSAAAILQSPRKRQPEHPLGTQKKRRKSCLNKHHLLEGVSLQINTPTAVSEARRLLSTCKTSGSIPIPNSNYDFNLSSQDSNDVFKFALNVVNGGGDYQERTALPPMATPPVSIHVDDGELFLTAVEELPFPVQVCM
jgi:hypothetical protein